MKKAITMACLGISMAAALAPAQARNDKLMVSINDALKVPYVGDVPITPATAAIQAKAPGVRYKLDDSVKLYFGPQTYPDSAQKFSTRQSVGKEAIENNDDVASCYASFNEALVKLQKHARKFGANAIINITSANLKNGQQVSSTTEFECHAGSFSTVVTLRGELARISGQ